MRIIKTKRGARPSREVRDWCSRFEEGCRSRGLRVTAQRRAVYQCLAEDTTHPTAEAIYSALRPKVTGLSLATVYRILESLEQEGFVRRVRTVDGAGRFDANLSLHQHLVCRRCGSITDSPLDLPVPQPLPRAAASGFVAEIFDLSLIGICAGCGRPRGRGARRTQPSSSPPRRAAREFQRRS
jgi:Fur family peroxide stress response transcriptional regulator